MWIAGEPRFRFGMPTWSAARWSAPAPSGRYPAVKLQDLADLDSIVCSGLERRHRLLEDDRNVVCRECANFALRQLDRFAPLELNAARGMRCGRVWQQASEWTAR